MVRRPLLSLLVAEHLGDRYEPLTFAVPFGSYGQLWTNDARIAPELRSYLDAHYRLWFTQPTANPPLSRAGRGTGERYRYTVLRGSSAERIYEWLAARSAE